MSNPETPSPALPTVVLTFLATPAPSTQESWVRAQVTNYATADISGLDTLYCSLLINAWELTACVDGSHAELFYRDDSTTITLLGDWPRALRDLRVLLADPRLDALLNLPTALTA